jgi:hypothetical protein
MIVGAFGGYPFGSTRVTFDIDILVDLREQDFDALLCRPRDDEKFHANGNHVQHN